MRLRCQRHVSAYWEGRRLRLAMRETPLSDIHLDNTLFPCCAGVVIFLPVPAFYTRPRTLDGMVMQGNGRMLDSFDIHTDGFSRWNGFEWNSKVLLKNGPCLRYVWQELKNEDIWIYIRKVTV